MRYFDRDELARRYGQYRPRVHSRVLEELTALRSRSAFERALDIACGTGHSAAALSTQAASVTGCDVSHAMLSSARREARDAKFCMATAESLPFPANAFDLITVSMAFHWFDQAEFLREAARVLEPRGELWVYNLGFPGVLVGDDAFFEWHRDRYHAKYPVPARHGANLADLVQPNDLPMQIADEHTMRYEVDFSLNELRNYFTTQSNVEAALRNGEPLNEIDAWLDAELAAFFEGASHRRFLYMGRAEIAVADG